VRPGVSPYRLFALSNLGSLLALIAYPVVMEPLLSRSEQAWAWSIGLIAFAVMCVACAIHVWRVRSPGEAVPVIAPADGRGRKSAGAGELALWLGLPMLASVMLLSVTNTITEDVASTPLLWVIPLTLYLLTFIIAFDSPRWYPRRFVLLMLPLATLWMLRLQWVKTEATLLEQLAGYGVALFLLCLFCHGELARRKPLAAESELTRYYLCIAIGGAAGGVLVAVVAPHVFNRLLELPLGVIGIAGLAFFCIRNDPLPDGKRWGTVFAAASVALLIGREFIKPLTLPQKERVVARARNFYGTLYVCKLDAAGLGDPNDEICAMYHGSIGHGAQYVAPQRRRFPTSYYGPNGGGGLTLINFPRHENRRVGLVGLGVGTLATYGKPGDTYRFYEINPDVERLAREYFSFLSDSPAKTDVVLGDARLSLEREEPQRFDVLVLDAFSGDSIPTHLLTSEAFDLYDRHLASDGVVAAHISNKTVNLIPVVLRQVERLGMRYAIINEDDPITHGLVSRWMLMSRNEAFMKSPPIYSKTSLLERRPEASIWTDDQINLLEVLYLVPREISSKRGG
jgi:hypothetical protein